MNFNFVVTTTIIKRVDHHDVATLSVERSFISAGRPYTGARAMKAIRINQENKVWVEDFEKRNAPR